MSEAITASPLTWPSGWPRTEPCDRTRARFSKRKYHTNQYSGYRYSSQGQVTIGEAIHRIDDSMSPMNVDWDDVIISTDLALRKDGLPRSGQREPEDPGAAVYWTTDTGESRCIAIDRYDRIADNLAAIAATLDAMRAIERHGGAEILDRAFTGFTALPNPADEPWWSILDYRSETDALSDDFTLKARRRMKLVHPDSSYGDPWLFARIKKALDDGRQVVEEIAEATKQEKTQ